MDFGEDFCEVVVFLDEFIQGEDTIVEVVGMAG